MCSKEHIALCLVKDENTKEGRDMGGGGVTARVSVSACASERERAWERESGGRDFGTHPCPLGSAVAFQTDARSTHGNVDVAVVPKAAFVHRCGRTARLGRDGKALVLLHPLEDTYVNFLDIRKIPILPLASPPAPMATLAAVRKLAANDREVYEKGRVAFVSFVRGYKEHQLSYIFRVKDLNFGPVENPP